MRKIAQICFLVFLVFFLGGCGKEEEDLYSEAEPESYGGQVESQEGKSKIEIDVADAVERMQNVCMARDPIDRAPCYREHEQAYFKHINSYAIDVLSRQSDFDEAWFETFRQMIASTEYNIGNRCMQGAGKNPMNRAVCNMTQYYFLSSWGDLLENDAWKYTELAQVGFRIVEARKQKKAAAEQALENHRAEVRRKCALPPDQRSAEDSRICPYL